MRVTNVTPTVPAEFSAVSFDRVLDMLIKANMEEANRIEQKRIKYSPSGEEVSKGTQLPSFRSVNVN